MLAIQHLLETRFSVLPGFTSEWLAERLRLLRQFSLPSVAAQSTERFTWLLFCDESTDSEIVDELHGEESSVPQLRVTLTSAERTRIQAVRALTRSDTDVVITTRLDADDAIADDYLAAIQDYAGSFHRSRHERLLVNFPDGYRLDTASRRLYEDRMPNSSFHSFFERPRDGAPRGVMSAGHRDLTRRYAGYERLPVLNEKGAGWHGRMHQHYATHQDESMRAWLIAVHGGNLVNRIPNTARELPSGSAPNGFTLGIGAAAR